MWFQAIWIPSALAHGQALEDIVKFVETPKGEKICAGDQESLNVDALKLMFVIEGVPQFKAFGVVYEKLKAIQAKALAKVNTSYT